ncbi:SlyX family protein [Bdellovibrio sp. 22V]|uniref:SlyX family protein n=1 Tax=Bdellovibrio TaxID=958 RepID=UPI0025433BE4|nr:SlyX family protein [Bdellovibrio sp. 22V]WII72282.1 SlyX family protein [Bdellovibrio sp. 22V]
MSEQRFIDIETKIAHQEYMIEELNQVLYEQQKTIDKLEGLLTTLTKRLEGLGDGDNVRGPGEKPPHY